MIKNRQTANNGKTSLRKNVTSSQGNIKKNAEPERIVFPTDSDFGEEIEDQYYKRMVPSGFVLSPKRNQEPPQLSIKSPAELLSGNDDPLMISGCGEEEEEDEDDIDLDEAQFAQLSVEEESQQDEVAFELANFDEIEYDVDVNDRFNEVDFHEFQKQLEQENGGGIYVPDFSPKDDGERNVLGLLENEQLLESQPEELEDDYGLRISSPTMRQRKEIFSSSVSPKYTEASNKHFPEQDPSDQQLMHDEYSEPQTSNAQPLEMLDSEKTFVEIGGQSSSRKSTNPDQSSSLAIQPISQLLLRMGSEPTTFKPAIQIKSFVKFEGSIPGSASSFQANTRSRKYKVVPSTSQLQQTPKEATEEEKVAQSQPSSDDATIVQVSQFTQQSLRKSAKKAQDHQHSIQKYTFEDELDKEDSRDLRNEPQSGRQLQSSHLSSARSHGGTNFNQVQNLTSQTLRVALGTMQNSELNETKGVELALRDLLKSSQSVKTFQRLQQNSHQSSNSSSKKNQRAVTQIHIRTPQMDEKLSQRGGISARSGAVSKLMRIDTRSQRPSGKVSCGPDGHETPESMQHYSKDLEEEMDISSEEEKRKKRENRPNFLELDKKMPAAFKQTTRSAKSSANPDSLLNSEGKEVNRKFLQDQDILDGPPQLDQKKTSDLAKDFQEFKTNIKFEFKVDSESDYDNEDKSQKDLRSNDQSDRMSDSETNLDARTQRQLLTQHTVKSPSNHYQIEEVALESALGNPAVVSKLQSQTSIGFAPHNRPFSEASQNRVDQKRQIDSKLSLIRRNADKLKQKRKEDFYKQTSAAVRNKQVQNTVAANLGQNYSRPKPLNWSRGQTSQKVLTKELAPEPLFGEKVKSKPSRASSSIRGEATQNDRMPSNLKEKKQDCMQRAAEPPVQNKQIKEVFQISRSNIPKKALINANNNIKRIRTTATLHPYKITSQKTVKSKAGQNNRDQSQNMEGGQAASHSQRTFDSKNGSGDQMTEVRSFKSVKANVLANNSLNQVGKHHLQTSVKTRILEKSEPKPQQLKFDQINNSSSEASLFNNRRDGSLQKLQEKYRRGSPRIYDEAPVKIQFYEKKSANEQKEDKPKNNKPSMSSVFESQQSKANSKPPRASNVKLSVVEVREQNRMENKEQVLRAQLQKIENKLDQKRREVSQGNKPTHKTPSADNSNYGSLIANNNVEGVDNKKTSFGSNQMTVTGSAQFSGKSRDRNSSSTQGRKTESVAESISKYKRKRMESLSKLSQVSQELAKKKEERKVAQSINPSIEEVKEAYQTPVSEIIPKLLQVEEAKLIQANQVRLYNQTKPIFESPRASTANQSQSHTDQKQAKTDFQSIHDAVAQNSFLQAKDFGYQALRQKNRQVLKNAEQFSSLKTYMQNYRGIQEQTSRLVPQNQDYNSLTSFSQNNGIKDESEQDIVSSAKRPYTSPDFSQLLDQSNHQHIKHLEATFKPSQRNSALRKGTGSSKKDQKRYSQHSSPYLDPSDSHIINANEGAKSPKVSLTPVLKNSSQAQKLKKESGKESANRSHMQKYNREKASELEAITSMFIPKDTSSIQDAVEQHQQSTNEQFYKSNLFRKLSKLANSNQSYSNDMTSMILRPDSQIYQRGVAKHPILVTDQTLNISAELSQVVKKSQLKLNMSNASKNSTSYERKVSSKPNLLKLEQKTMGDGSFFKQPQNLVGKAKPPKTSRKIDSTNLTVNKTLNERQMSQKTMKGVDFIEETKDYQKVIHDLNDLLYTQYQPKPLGASSTSHISYHTHRVQQSPPTKSKQDCTSSQGKMSPRVMKMIQGQLLVSQKPIFSANAVIKVSPRRLQNQTVAHATINSSALESYQTLSPRTKQGHVRRMQRHNCTTLDADQDPNHQRMLSQNSYSVQSGVHNLSQQARILPFNKTSQHAQITLKATKTAGKTFLRTTDRTFNTTIGSQLSCLTQAEKRRKEQFDRSLQREVEAIEQVISHRSSQKKARAMEAPVRINNYVEGLKQLSQIVDVDQVFVGERRQKSDNIKVNHGLQNTHQTYQSQSQFCSTTERKTQELLEQIQKLQPMLLHVQAQNRREQEQLNELLYLHEDVQHLKDSSEMLHQVISQQQQQHYESVHQLVYDRPTVFGGNTQHH